MPCVEPNVGERGIGVEATLWATRATEAELEMSSRLPTEFGPQHEGEEVAFSFMV